jgi:phenylalanyl-tRNA synthetase beta chain
MKASYNWLRALLPGLSASPQDVADRLTSIGLEVEGVSRFGEGIEPVVLAQVKAIEAHPSRSGLRLVTVDRGDGLQRVVCGAPNVPDPGGLVVLAPLGTHLPAKGMTIEPRPIGGVVSEGMLCSESELGIGAGEGGILVLPSDAGKAGQRLVDAIPSASDVIFEINVTPNRPDALGHAGLARDLAASYGLPFAPPRAPGGAATSEVEAGTLVTVKLEDAERCPHYGAAVVLDVQVRPSPLAVQHRLHSLGVRPISNLVDVTNLVMLELGQPMHAFDLDLVSGATLRVRRAAEGEELVTLDGKTRKLSADDLVIADAERAVALAGVMGGASTEIRPETRRVLLECAWFEPRGVRRTSRRHGLHSESSHRFERGVDRGGVRSALGRAAALLAELSSGKLAKGEVHGIAGEARARTIRLRSSRIDAVLGVAVPFGEALGILGRLGCKATERTGERDTEEALIEAPTHRPDLEREADLLDEVARIRGLAAIPTELPPIVPQAPRSGGDVEKNLRTAAVELGLSEAVTYAFVSPRELSDLGAPPAVTLENPLTAERSVLRTSVLPGLLEAVVRARRHGERTARLFTIGRSFHAAPAGASLPRERRWLAVALSGPRPGYLQKPEDHDVFDAKGIAEELVRRVTRDDAEVIATPHNERPPHLHPRGTGDVIVRGERVGRFGPLHPDVVERRDLGGPVMVVELDIDALSAVGRRVPQAAPVPRLPAALRDVAFVVHDDVAAGDLARMIKDAAGDLCEDVVLFDLFRGGNVPEGHRSLAFHVVYRDPKARTGAEGARTLTDPEVDDRHAGVVSAVRDRLGAVLRALTECPIRPPRKLRPRSRCSPAGILRDGCAAGRSWRWVRWPRSS